MSRHVLYVLFCITIHHYSIASQPYNHITDNKERSLLEQQQKLLAPAPARVYPKNNRHNQQHDLLPWHKLCRKLTKDLNNPAYFHVIIEPSYKLHEIIVSSYGKNESYPTYNFHLIVAAITGSFSPNISNLHKQKLEEIISGTTREWSFAYDETHTVLSKWSKEKNNWIQHEKLSHTDRTT